MSSRGCAVIEVEYSGHGGVAFDALAGVGGTGIGIDHPIADALVRSSLVIEVGVGSGDVGEPPIADEADAIEAFVFERAEEAFDVSVAV